MHVFAMPYGDATDLAGAEKGLIWNTEICGVAHESDVISRKENEMDFFWMFLEWLQGTATVGE